jgi:hypothetical protein
MFRYNLQIEKEHGRSSKWKLLRDLAYVYEPRGEEPYLIVVPNGFETDLATNWIRGRHDSAAVLHDYLIEETGNYWFANQVMNQAMKDSDVRSWHRWLIMTGVTVNAVFQTIKEIFK